MLEKLSKMSTRQAMIALVGRPPTHGELPRWLSKVAQAAGISFRTARSLWNEEITNPDHLAAQAVRREAQILEAKRNASNLAGIYQGAAIAMQNVDADFYRDQIAAFFSMARQLGAVDGAGTEGK